MKTKRIINLSLYAAAGVIMTCAFLLTFTLSDYYIFNRIYEFGFFFCFSQWVKKAGLLLIALAVFCKSRTCADAVKYALPLFVILSCFLFGGFFDVTKPAITPEQEIYNSINLLFPKGLNIALFFIENALMLAVCALLFVRDGYKVNPKCFISLAPALLICMPLNIFENFFDITKIDAASPLRFKNFTVWHFLAIAVLAGFTIGAYYFLKNKTREKQDLYLTALAVALLLQYHSKDSMVLGDGYNVYHTIFACIPLFICNIGVYVASISVMVKKKVLYAISFFIHAVGALTVFVYFGKNEMSNYGIFCSYSILYFCLTHCFLFALSVLPTALGHYKFTFRDCIIPLAYYFVVIILASLCSALVTSASMGWHTAEGFYLPTDKLLYPNYAFTQINPLPFDIPPVLTLTVWRYQINLLYVLGLYAAYVCLFFAFTGAYYAFLAIRKKVLDRVIYAGQFTSSAETEAAATDEKDDE